MRRILLFLLITSWLVYGADKQPELFVVGYAHLDTQWRWEYPQVISEYIPKTMRDNFILFEKYPHYIFNFTGANRYHMMKEYYPADYAKVKQYIKENRWFPAGSSMEEGDVNSPSPESIIRQVLYGNEFFRHEFGVASAEYMLPDCFGFPASLPSILAQAGVKGFSTQKLTWGSAADVGGPNSPEKTPEGIPYNVGLWIGPDGKGVIAALNPQSYTSKVRDDLSKDAEWLERVQLDGQVSGLPMDYHYYGTGDTGGAPDEDSVKWVETSVTSNGPLHVVGSKADQMFLDIKPDEEGRLPRYKGDLELTNHSAGSLTSEAYHKRWNRKNEILADAAEETSVAAAWLGARPYPQPRLNEAWRLVMGGQFHDIMAGTATPKSYEYSWNDDVVAMNQFATVLSSAADAVISEMNTKTKGVAVAVYNPLSISREDVVEAKVTFPNGVPKAVRVYGPDGKEVPAQLDGHEYGTATVAFLAKVPSVGFAVYDVRPSDTAGTSSELHVTESSLENARYRVKLDENGDVSSIFDKRLNRELLSGPARLAFQYEQPEQWPAWNMDWNNQQKPPYAYLGGPAQTKIVENGPARVALEVTREGQGSKFVQTIRLAAGDAGNRVQFANAIDWKTGHTALKAAFPLAASNPEATYNWGAGTIERGNNDPKKFEVASHQWFDLTDRGGQYGVTVLSDCKTGSDKPNDNTLRLTLIYTPGVSQRNRQYEDQATQDWGHHEFIYGLASHAGDWREGQTDWQAMRLNVPPIVFASDKHSGSLGKEFSLLNVSNGHVRVMALKKAEDSDDLIVRLVENDGQPQQDVHIKFAAPVTEAREVNGQEQPVGAANVANGEIVTSFTPYEMHTFALKLGSAPLNVAATESQPVSLQYDRAVASADGTKSNGGFNDKGEAIPAEMLPQEIRYNGIRFHLAPATEANAVIAKGQSIALPSGHFNRVYVLAAAEDGDQRAVFRAGNKSVELTVEDWGGFVGQWDDRIWTTHQETFTPRRLPPSIPPGTPQAERFMRPRTRTIFDYQGLRPGYIKRASIAWYASHRHTADGANEPYSYSYLFAYPIDVPANAKTLTLPNDDKIRVLAVTVAEEKNETHPAWPLYDTLGEEGTGVRGQ